jgi:hypothetical protein
MAALLRRAGAGRRRCVGTPASRSGAIRAAARVARGRISLAVRSGAGRRPRARRPGRGQE